MGHYGTGSTADSEDQYITSVFLENQKDRALTIYGIYVELTRGMYLEVDNFEKKPVVLKAFESYSKGYDPVMLYGINGRRAELNDLFRHDRKKMPLLLSTSLGKVRVKWTKRYWVPELAFFENVYGGVVQTLRLTHKGKGYGGNIRYVVKFHKPDADDEIIAVHEKLPRWQYFKNFSLTEESIETQDKLQAFLDEKIAEGILPCQSVTVLDIKDKKDELKASFATSVAIQERSWFRYHILGRLYASLQKISLRQKNRSLKSEG